jgi:hypothetical protein
MSFSSSHQDTSGSTTNTLDPQYSAAVYGNYARAQALANTPFQPYSGQQVASFAPAQLQAQNAFTTIGQGDVGAAPLQAGINLASGAGAYQPQQVSTTPLTGVDLSGYMNPYQSDVINASIDQAMRAKGISDANDASKATAAGAFGGSRSAVLQNLDDNSWQQNLQQTLAGLNAGNFTQAQSAAQNDLQRQLQASQANQSAGLQGATLNLNAANSLANMSGEQLSQALQRAGALSTAGDAQQQNQQAQLNAAYQQWLLAQQYPIQMQNLLNSTIQTIPKTGTTDTNESQTKEGANFNLFSGTPFSFVSRT